MRGDDSEHVVESRAELSAWVRRERRLNSASRFYVRFGRWTGERSVRGLDDEFLVTLEGGAYDPHRAEGGSRVTRYERGLSVYFALPAEDGTGWHMLEPSRRRALYGLPGDYLVDMCQRVFFNAICAGDVFLVEGRPVVQRLKHAAYVEDERQYVDVTHVDYETGADGEPIAQDLRVVARFDVWGEGTGPRLYVGYPGERRIELLPYLVRHQSLFKRQFSLSRDETCSVLSEELDE